MIKQYPLLDLNIFYGQFEDVIKVYFLKFRTPIYQMCSIFHLQIGTSCIYGIKNIQNILKLRKGYPFLRYWRKKGGGNKNFTAMKY